ncbi:LacI family DNA-binding transcriptional regulator [Leucobacter chinensis]|uniref:LacI family DNA-binding transcriptional regulator n=1 Tax=Leucobacter chinensis TaxID=2851010 RepID=UPI001C22E6EB
MSQRTKVTISQVAEAAGVSPATVSLVFNNKGKVAPATRERVLEIGKNLGYRPGWISRVFRSGRTHVIGVVVGHSGTPLWGETYFPYYRGIIAGAAMEALNFGYTITVVPVTDTGQLGGPIRPDGIILVDPGPEDSLIETALHDGITVVTAGGHITSYESPRLRGVEHELKTGVGVALDTLREHGATRPAFYRGSALDAYTVESQRTYEQWCQKNGIEPLLYVLPAGHDPVEGARELLDGEHGYLDGIYCINESYSSAVTAVAEKRGLRIPDDLHVGVAGEPHSGGVDPRLVYFDLNPVDLGAACAQVLVHMLEAEAAQEIAAKQARANK